MALDAGWMDQWDRKRAAIAKIKAEGKVQVTLCKTRIQVVCPDSNRFAVEAGKVGIYRHRTGIWTFHVWHRQVVRDLLEKYWPGKVRFPNV